MHRNKIKTIGGIDMAATRQDAWSEDDDLLLAEVTLRHIREGSTQLAAFEEVGYRLQRTAAACGFRWNSLVRKKYESAIQIAKAQRQQRKSRGKSRFIPEQEPFSTGGYATNSYTNRLNQSSDHGRMKEFSLPQVRTYNEKNYAEYQTEMSEELNGASHSGTAPSRLGMS